MKQLNIKSLFDTISEREGHTFEPNVPYIPKTKFKIETKTGFEEVGSMIIKDDMGFTLSTEKGDVKVSAKHRIMTSEGLKFVNELSIGDKLENTSGDVEITDIKVTDLVQVYDISIGTEDHLYLDADGFVHHNTYHITEGPRSLSKILGPEGDKWTYHSGTKAAPFAFYKTLFQERDKIIVFDEADSLLKNPDIVMMLKPILDTSGKNMAEYMSGTQNMVGNSDAEIEAYAKDVDREIFNGTPIGVGKNDIMLPSKFKFTGGMIFISNMRANQIEGAIMSRSIFVDVYLAQQDILKRIKSIAMHKYGNDIAEELMEGLGQTSNEPEVEVQYMTPEYARKIKPFTVRSMDLAYILKTSGLSRWADLAQLYA